MNKNRKIVKANTENVPIRIIGLRPYRSANFPQKIDVKALPIMNDDPNKSYIETSRIFQDLYSSNNKESKANNKTKCYQQNQHRNQYLLLVLQYESL